ncbi:cell division initiation protein [Dyadobacter jejuensis]|uniref:Cell division initiation protein n=1 Tax=Dyadobacter jejuensis TaxID=1082580 RepID=A0A316A9B7_9BACT|nr:DivIVA domain-containing protein [Dyadobacter jejuensis]PWJ54516.1 cell division initiation protein [Dyadobacter jejuensis]
MKISAIDIRKHTFEKIFRGYEPEAVDAFLNSLSQEWERFTSENRQLKAQLEQTQNELAKLKDIESSLFRTLKTAEETGRQIEKEALEEAEKRKEEAISLSDSMILEAEERTQKVIADTELRLQNLKEEFVNEVKNQERDFRAIENYRDNLMVQLSSLANNTLETIERFEQKYDRESVLNKMDEIKQHVAQIEIPKKPIEEKQEEKPVEAAIPLASGESEAIIPQPPVAKTNLNIARTVEPNLQEEEAKAAPVSQDTARSQEANPEIAHSSEADNSTPIAEAQDKNLPTPPAQQATEPSKPKAPEPSRANEMESGGSFFDQI